MEIKRPNTKTHICERARKSERGEGGRERERERERAREREQMKQQLPPHPTKLLHDGSRCRSINSHKTDRR
jgi:hypothetical protein